MSYVTEVLADSPKAYWECQDAAGLPQDASGNGLHMSAVDGSPSYHAAGPMGDFSILCNGGDRFRLNPLASTVSDNFTWEMWQKLTVVSANNEALDAWNSSNDGWSILADTDFSIKAVVKPAGTAQASLACGSGTWRHIVIVRDSGTWKYYLDGAISNSNAGTSAPGTPVTGQTFFGCAGSVQANKAHVAMYETVLSAVRVAAHYAAAAATFVPQIVIT